MGAPYVFSVGGMPAALAASLPSVWGVTQTPLGADVALTGVAQTLIGVSLTAPSRAPSQHYVFLAMARVLYDVTVAGDIQTRLIGFTHNTQEPITGVVGLSAVSLWAWEVNVPPGVVKTASLQAYLPGAGAATAKAVSTYDATGYATALACWLLPCAYGSPK